MSQNQTTDDRAAHMAHCNRDEWIGCCKYGEDLECPALGVPVTLPEPLPDVIEYVKRISEASEEVRKAIAPMSQAETLRLRRRAVMWFSIGWCYAWLLAVLLS